jgi:hypothetical protein
MDPIGQKSMPEAHGIFMSAFSQKKPNGQVSFVDDPSGQYSPNWHGTGATVALSPQKKPAGQDGQSFSPFWP